MAGGYPCECGKCPDEHACPLWSEDFEGSPDYWTTRLGSDPVFTDGTMQIWPAGGEGNQVDANGKPSALALEVIVDVRNSMHLGEGHCVIWPSGAGGRSVVVVFDGSNPGVGIRESPGLASSPMIAFCPADTGDGSTWKTLRITFETAYPCNPGAAEEFTDPESPDFVVKGARSAVYLDGVLVNAGFNWTVGGPPLTLGGDNSGVAEFDNIQVNALKSWENPDCPTNRSICWTQSDSVPSGVHVEFAGFAEPFNNNSFTLDQTAGPYAIEGDGVGGDPELCTSGRYSFDTGETDNGKISNISAQFSEGNLSLFEATACAIQVVATINDEFVPFVGTFIAAEHCPGASIEITSTSYPGVTCTVTL